METITLNYRGGRTRKVTIAGRNYTVAPMALIVPGVLNGSNGALYYPPEEVSKDPRTWNGVAITNGHPYCPTTNQPQSAKEAGVWDRVGLGTIKNAKWDGEKLRAEGWFDDEYTKAKAPDVWNALQQGSAFELSTGLGTTNTPAQGNYKGKAYTHIARNYRGDHVAVLMHETGACSVTDGCGVFNANPEGHNQYTGAASAGPKRSTASEFSRKMVAHFLAKGDHKTAGHYAAHSAKNGKFWESRSDHKNAKEEHEDAAHAYEQLAKHDAPNAAKHQKKADFHKKKAAAITVNADSDTCVLNASGYCQNCMAHEKHIRNEAEATQTSNQEPVMTPTRTEMLAKLTANCSCQKEKDAFNAFGDATVATLYKAQFPDKPAGTPTNNSTATSPPPSPPPPPPAPVATTTNTVATPEPAKLSEADQAVLNYGRQAMERDKTAVINRLTGHITDATQKQTAVTALNAKSLSDLQFMLSVMPAQPVQNAAPAPSGVELLPMFLGAGGGADHSVTNAALPNGGVVEVTHDWPPTLNYAEMANLPGQKAATAA